MLIISEEEIRQSGRGGLLAVLWRQWCTERALARRGIHFRATEIDQVAAGYAAMSQEEFDAVNGRQDWANWRTIPRALNDHVPDEPLRVLDLGCGSGNSTRVLAHYCPRDSRITGYECAEPLLTFARRREYRHRTGARAQVDFVCQGVTQKLCGPAGNPISGGCVNLINASGVVGHHLNPETFSALLAEIARVLAPSGVAMLDVGPTLPGPVLQSLMAAAHFTFLGHYRSWFGDPTGEMVFRRHGR
ncbi:MAG: class I SAM-dependent methyltransferase [Gemmataceae bacterium]|nr:class I SAM-dependent methyltransferase [Gemmataceae bacterium]